MNLAVGAVTAALVAAVAVVAFLLVRTLSTLRRLKASLEEFRGAAEPLAREVAGLAEQVSAHVGIYQSVFGGDGTGKGRRR